jgi:hypothetical protein
VNSRSLSFSRGLRSMHHLIIKSFFVLACLPY